MNSICKFIDSCVSRIAETIQDEFDETKHPRDDEGKFATKGSSSSYKLRYPEAYDNKQIWENARWALKEEGLKVVGGAPDKNTTLLKLSDRSGKTYELPIKVDTSEGYTQVYINSKDVIDLLEGGAEDPHRRSLRMLNQTKKYLTKEEAKVKPTQAEKDAVKEYTSHLSNKINRALRRKSVPDGRMSDVVSALDSLISKTKLSKKITVYRKGPLKMLGLGPKSTLRSLQDAVGSVFLDNAYMSTSINPEDETVESDSASTDVMMVMTVPPGVRGVYAAPMSGYEGEEEYLLKRGTYYKLVSVEKADDMTGAIGTKYIAHVEVIDKP